VSVTLARYSEISSDDAASGEIIPFSFRNVKYFEQSELYPAMVLSDNDLSSFRQDLKSARVVAKISELRFKKDENFKKVLHLFSISNNKDTSILKF